MNLNPATVNVAVTVVGLDTTRTSSVVLGAITGTASGAFISAITYSPMTVTLTGSQDIINGASLATVTTGGIDVAGQTGTVTYKVPIETPTGISASTATATVTITLSLIPTPTPVATPTPVPASAPPGSGTTNVSGSVDSGFLGLSVPANVTIPLVRNATNNVDVPVTIYSNILWNLQVSDPKTTHTGQRGCQSKMSTASSAVSSESANTTERSLSSNPETSMVSMSKCSASNSVLRWKIPTLIIMAMFSSPIAAILRLMNYATLVSTPSLLPQARKAPNGLACQARNLKAYIMQKMLYMDITACRLTARKNSALENAVPLLAPAM